MTTKSVLFVPYWLREKMQRHGLPLSALDDPHKLSEVLCMEDLATIYALNRKVEDAEPFKGDHTSYELLDLRERWRAKNFKNFDYLDSIAYSKPIEQELTERLSVDNQLDESDPDKGTFYKLVDIERAYCVMVIYPGFFESLALPRFQYSLITRLLEVFYVYFGAVKCFELPLFGKYLRLLQGLSKA